MAEHVRSPSAPPEAVLATADDSALSVKQIILAYWRFAETYYSKNGEPSDRLYHVRLALRPLRKLYGDTLASEFGPRKLKNVREEMILAGLESGRGLNRNYINDHTGIIKRMFRWAVGEELVPTQILQVVSVPSRHVSQTR